MIFFQKGEAMATKIRPELSVNNRYHLEKHRYYELKHFCLQYPLWKKELVLISSVKTGNNDISGVHSIGSVSDPTADNAEERLFYALRMEMLEKTARNTDCYLSDYILKGVAEGFSYEYLKAKLNIPCCREKYYELYRKFFYLLSAERQ